MKKIYKTKKKKIEVTSAPPFDWPWFDRFNNIFHNIAKINDIPNAIDQDVCVMNFETKVVNVSDEKDVQIVQMLRSPKRQIPMFRDDTVNVGTTSFVNLDSPRTGACKLPGVQGKPNKKLERKKR